ncbi:peptide deformylase [Zhihengliuella salsuginis]|uniref:Peptide deformylase n=1 Tax=Zhihengliuella salsuginis TaxID=578222 RepID=A0ABQ3GKJ8_9MICC|nr:peptide deformylase [Zhihengliuella salsuginis]GHD12666.1 peptide deformylase [Zhihengliuella salsuginis]
MQRPIDTARTLIDAGEDGPLPAIVQMGHPALRTPAAPYDGELTDHELLALLGVMRRTMHAAPGVGLAAPQIGLGWQLAVIEDSADVVEAVAAERERTPLPYFPVLNPSYSPMGEETAGFFEGCLSMAGYQAVVERPREIAATYYSTDGEQVSRELTGWPARIYQHETDHLAGTVYIDRAETRSLTSAGEYLARYSTADIQDVRQALGF